MQLSTSGIPPRLTIPRRRVFFLPAGSHLFVVCAVLALLFGPLSPLRAQESPGVIRPFDQAMELYDRADQYYQYGNDVQDLTLKRDAYGRAIPLFRQFLMRRPQNELAQKASYQLGMALLLTGDRSGAESTFRNIIDRYKTGNWVAFAAYRLAAQLHNRKEWSRAAPYFSIAAREATQQDLGHKAIYYEARCLKYAGRVEEAIESLQKIIDDPRNPFREYARLTVGELHAEAGRHEKALENFEFLLGPSVAPQERARALLAAGVSASKLGQQEKAESFLNQTLDALGVDSKYKARAQHALMEMRFEEENYGEVVKIFRRGEFIGEDLIMAKIYMMAGLSFAKLDRHSEAIRQFFHAERLAMSLGSEAMEKMAFEANYRRVASFYEISGPNIPDQVDEFVSQYAKAHPASPWLHKARLMKAESLFHRGSLRDAAAAYVSINASALPEELRADTYFKRGWCLSDLGEHTRAEQNLSSFIANYPDHPRIDEAYAKRGEAFQEIGDNKSALKDFERLLERNPDPALAAFAHQHAAQIHAKNQNYRKMIESYQKLLEGAASLGGQTRADAHFWIGVGHYRLGEWAEAIAPLETARELMPHRYREAAGVQIVLAAYSLLDSDKLKEAVDRLMVDAPLQRPPVRMLIWLGLERFSKGDYEGADRFLGLASTPDDPEATDVLVWRHLAKSQIELGHFQRALSTLEILLLQEQEDFWKADAQLDRSHALSRLDRWEEAGVAAHEGLQLNPQGTVRAGLYMALADVAMHRQDYESAAAGYLRTAEMFIDDKEIKPLALSKAADALEKNNRQAEAAEIRSQLKDEFPNWVASAEP